MKIGFSKMVGPLVEFCILHLRLKVAFNTVVCTFSSLKHVSTYVYAFVPPLYYLRFHFFSLPLSPVPIPFTSIIHVSLLCNYFSHYPIANHLMYIFATQSSPTYSSTTCCITTTPTTLLKASLPSIPSSFSEDLMF